MWIRLTGEEDILADSISTLSVLTIGPNLSLGSMKIFPGLAVMLYLLFLFGSVI